MKAKANTQFRDPKQKPKAPKIFRKPYVRIKGISKNPPKESKPPAFQSLLHSLPFPLSHSNPKGIHLQNRNKAYQNRITLSYQKLLHNVTFPQELRIPFSNILSMVYLYSS